MDSSIATPMRPGDVRRRRSRGTGSELLAEMEMASRTFHFELGCG